MILWAAVLAVLGTIIYFQIIKAGTAPLPGANLLG
jgi:hypothetical protein